MISATALKNGTTFLLSGTPYRVVKYAHQKIGRGGATVKLSARNLVNGNLEEKTMNSTLKVDEIATVKKQLTYLYQDGVNASFMDPASFEQIEVPVEVLGDDLAYIKEGGNADVLFWGDKALSVEIPPKVTLTVVETDPGVKGNTASNIYKPAKVENGILIKVPLFVKSGDKIRVDTRTGEYVERVS